MGNFIESKPVCLCSAELPDEMQTKLSEKFRVIPLPADEDLAKPVRCHPDMICAVVESRIIFPSDYAAKNQRVIDMIGRLSGCSVVLTDAPRGEKYPADVGLNAAIGHDFVVCRAESTAPELITAAQDSKKHLISVRQGYTGCSCIVASDAVLTSDRSIFAALTDAGINATFADNSGIILSGYNVGFIGGCGGYFDGTLYFFGDFSALACCEAIENFAAQNGFKICKLGKNKLTDYGGMKILKIPQPQN